MNNETQENTIEKYKKFISEILLNIQNDYKLNTIMPNILYKLNNYLTEFKNKKIKQIL